MTDSQFEHGKLDNIILADSLESAICSHYTNTGFPSLLDVYALFKAYHGGSSTSLLSSIWYRATNFQWGASYPDQVRYGVVKFDSWRQEYTLEAKPNGFETLKLLQFVFKELPIPKKTIAPSSSCYRIFSFTLNRMNFAISIGRSDFYSLLDKLLTEELVICEQGLDAMIAANLERTVEPVEKASTLLRMLCNDHYNTDTTFETLMIGFNDVSTAFKRCHKALFSELKTSLSFRNERLSASDIGLALRSLSTLTEPEEDVEKVINAIKSILPQTAYSDVSKAWPKQSDTMPSEELLTNETTLSK